MAPAVELLLLLMPIVVTFGWQTEGAESFKAQAINVWTLFIWHHKVHDLEFSLTRSLGQEIHDSFSSGLKNVLVLHILCTVNLFSPFVIHFMDASGAYFKCHYSLVTYL